MAVIIEDPKTAHSSFFLLDSLPSLGQVFCTLFLLFQLILTSLYMCFVFLMIVIDVSIKLLVAHVCIISATTAKKLLYPCCCF